MKCPNCGFESEGNFCSLCGKELKSVNTQSTPPPKPNSTFVNQPSNTQANQGNNTFVNQPNNTQPNQGNSNTFVNQPTNTQPNQSNSTFINQPNFTPNNQTRFTQQPPNTFPSLYSPAEIEKEKRTRLGKFIFMLIIGAIILAGIVIIFMSAVANSDQNPFQPTTKTTIDNYDSVQHEVGETAETPFGNVTLTSVETGNYSTDIITDQDYSTDDLFDEVSKEYKFTFDIVNDTDEDLNVNYNNFNVAVKGSNLNYSFTNFEVEGNPSSITVKPNSNGQFVIYRYAANQTEDTPIIITYNYTYSDNQKGTVLFCKNRPNEGVMGSIFDEYETGFGCFVITDVRMPSPAEIVSTYFKDSNTHLTEDDFKVGYNNLLYEFTVEVTNNNANRQSVSLNSINGTMDLGTSDELASEVIRPIAAVGENYSYNIYDSGSSDVYFLTPAGETKSYKFLVYINDVSNGFDITFGFGNGDKITVESSVDELKSVMVKNKES